MKYQVIDNNRPADTFHIRVHKSWNNSSFDTFEEAVIYANKWLGNYGPIDFALNQEYDYSGFGDIIKIIQTV